MCGGRAASGGLRGREKQGFQGLTRYSPSVCEDSNLSLHCFRVKLNKPSGNFEMALDVCTKEKAVHDKNHGRLFGELLGLACG